MSPKPALLASMLRQRCNVDDRIPVDVDRILGECPIEVAEIPLDGFLGLYVPPPDGPGMLIASGQADGQRRFTVAHELGHFAIPTHGREAQLVCLADDIHRANHASSREREANEFAAELLMPRSLFGAAVRGRDPTFTLVHELASVERFRVSRTAAAIRTVELTRESCALICSTEGRVEWWVKSPNCDFYLESGRGNPLPPGSVAAAVARGEGANHALEDVDPGTWFHPGDRRVEVLESTFEIPSLGLVLSIVWSLAED